MTRPSRGSCRLVQSGLWCAEAEGVSSRHRTAGALMAETSTIEWTDATWNPVTGCTKISAGCDNCYAERFSERFRGVPGHPFETGFDLTLRPARLTQPLSWRQPKMVFVNSMSDLFHKGVPSAFIDRVFDTMEQADWHTFQVLTKRSSLMRGLPASSVRNGTRPGTHLVRCVRRGREQAVPGEAPSGRSRKHPLPVHRTVDRSHRAARPLGYRLVIVGGESGPRARPMSPDGVRESETSVAGPVSRSSSSNGGAIGRRRRTYPRWREWSEFPGRTAERLPDAVG